MIPISLKLSNFTSYGEKAQVLDFTKFKLASISGLNGAGKSSLLDSITWCIWGSSRAGDSSDELVHKGADNMQVEFSFKLDSYIFTVKRRRVKKSGGSTALELWSNSHNLTEGTIKSTQEKIIKTLHLNFETFTNSSYLRQGHEDEFTTKGPTDRKRILSDILGLENYDMLEEKAKEKVKSLDNNLKLVEYQLLELENELSQKEEREKILTQKEQEAQKIESQLLVAEQLIKSIQQQHQVISTAIKFLGEKKSQIESVTKELNDINLQIIQKEKAKEEFQNILTQKESILENYQKLQVLENQKKLLEDKRSIIIKTKDQLADIQRILTTREERRTQEINKLEIEIKKFETENEQLKLQIKHLTENKSKCPTCGQQIDNKINNHIVSTNNKIILQNESETNELNIKIKKYQQIILPEKKESDQLDAKIKQLEQETKDWNEIVQKIANLEKFSMLYTKLQQAETGKKSYDEAVIDLKKIYQNKVEFIDSQKKELKELEIYEKQLEEIKIKLRAEELIKSELSQKTLELRGQVGEARQLVSRSQQLEKHAVLKNEERQKLQKDKDIFEELALAFGKRGIQAMIIESAIPEIEEEANNLLNRLTEGRMKITLLTQRETKTKVAGGEKGIVETLDIIISDEMGERPYELYSGGEAFRVNFAIRLAISKLLTHRAGAKLQFLVIDEGFGSQDAPGRARLIEAIDAIKDEFEKILIVTHIEELKEEFPIRIEVSKNTGGSTFEIVGI